MTSFIDKMIIVTPYSYDCSVISLQNQDTQRIIKIKCFPIVDLFWKTGFVGSAWFSCKEREGRGLLTASHAFILVVPLAYFLSHFFASVHQGSGYEHEH